MAEESEGGGDGRGEENEGRREFGSDIDVEGSTHISSSFTFI